MAIAGKNLIKRNDIKFSKWNNELLSNDQIRYAANDAFAGFLIYEKLRNPSFDFCSCREIIKADMDNYLRVLLDVFHLMERFEVSKKHPLYGVFVKFLRDAIFVVDSEDVRHVKDHITSRLKNNEVYSEEELKKISKSYILSCGKVKRKILDKHELAESISRVVEYF